MDQMHRFNCSTILQQECGRRYFAYTPFSELVYSRFCNITKFRNYCLMHSLDVFRRYNIYENNIAKSNITEYIYGDSWNDLVLPLVNISINDDSFDDPCVQVNMFDLPSGNYHEVMFIYQPYCGDIWCGVNSAVPDFNKFSPWTCIPMRCKITIISISIICVIMSLLTTIANVVVIGVFLKTEKLRNNQSLYKMSIAFSDLIVGLFVFPSIIVTTYFSYSSSNLPFGYYNTIGFITTLSVSVSLLTLIMSGFDRVFAMMRPMKYSHRSTRKIAYYVIGATWCISSVVALLPILIPSVGYHMTTSRSLISIANGHAALAVIGIPLIMTWINGIAVYSVVKTRSNIRRPSKDSSASPRSRRRIVMEKKLAITLCIMIGVFTVCVLPSFVQQILGSAGLFRNANFAVFTTSEAFVVITFLSNSLWNCFIYNFRHTDFRERAKNIFCSKFKSNV
ncbi:histamine H2 receptor-like [Styela clava]